MTAYEITHDRPNCIGCGACAVICSSSWEMEDNDGKSNLKGAKKNDDGTEAKDIEEKDFEKNKEAADACPGNVIHIINKDTKDKLI